MTKICIFGGGQMGSALLGGILAAEGAKPEEFAIVEPSADQRVALEKRFPGVVVSDGAVPADVAIFAMKPMHVEAACKALVPESFGCLISIAAGITIASLESWLWSGARVIRCMPNTPALVGTGASGIAAGHFATDEDLRFADEILSSVGVVVQLDEDLMDAVTGLSGSGPAYVFYLAEAMITAGKASGLSDDVAVRLTNQTLLGAAKMLIETGRPPEELRAAVTSPSGTTAAGIAELDRLGVKDAVISAISCAVARSKEMGRPAS